MPVLPKDFKPKTPPYYFLPMELLVNIYWLSASAAEGLLFSVVLALVTEVRKLLAGPILSFLDLSDLGVRGFIS
jgi:hypothetical protein